MKYDWVMYIGKNAMNQIILHGMYLFYDYSWQLILNNINCVAEIYTSLKWTADVTSSVIVAIHHYSYLRCEWRFQIQRWHFTIFQVKQFSSLFCFIIWIDWQWINDNNKNNDDRNNFRSLNYMAIDKWTSQE